MNWKLSRFLIRTFSNIHISAESASILSMFDTPLAWSECNVCDCAISCIICVYLLNGIQLKNWLEIGRNAVKFWCRVHISCAISSPSRIVVTTISFLLGGKHRLMEVVGCSWQWSEQKKKVIYSGTSSTQSVCVCVSVRWCAYECK